MVIAERLPATLGGRAESTQNPFLATGSAEAHASKPEAQAEGNGFFAPEPLALSRGY